jgi:glutamate-1-semialdehyde 2,1-aminomutase
MKRRKGMTNQTIEEQYYKRTPRSKGMYDRAIKSLPGGVAGNGKFLPPYPIYVSSAEGAELVDIDGNRYIDLLMGVGTHILGHSPLAVVKAIREQVERGTLFFIPAEAEVKLSEKICQLMPSVDMVRFVNTGSEATAMAIRAARAYTGREKIARYEGNFHGSLDWALISEIGVAGPPDAPEPHFDSVGIPHSVSENLLILPYNDVDFSVKSIAHHADELAAVILEPYSGFGLGCVAPEPGFLETLREVTTEHEIPLIFDEVVTNFRLALGGAAEYFGILPDMVCLGKVLGGGLPVGGFGGRREIMEKVVTPRGGEWELTDWIFQSGTFSGNPLTMVAGLAVIEELEKGDVYPHINNLGELVREGLTNLADRLGVDMLVTGETSIFQIHFGVREIKNKRDAMTADKEATNLFHLGLRAKGVFASSHALFLSAAHTEEDIHKVLEVAEEVLLAMKQDNG